MAATTRGKSKLRWQRCRCRAHVPRRWVVERTFPRFGGNRRLAKYFENLAETMATFVTLASIQLALRRLARA
jgi:transposase